MQVELAYGKRGLTVTLPDAWDITIVEPVFTPELPEPRQALRQALRAPYAAPALRDQVRASDTVGIIFSDITRPTPNHVLLPAILDELPHVPVENVTLFNALGTHRANTEAELRGMLGDAIVDRYRIAQNDAFDPSTQVFVGQSTRGNDVWLNRDLVECDVKILTGFIEPHFFAGFSGGGKAVMPGMAGQRTVFGNHNASMIADPQATWGVIDGNPIQEEINEIVHLLNRTFLVNVTLNKDKAITGVFAGDLDTAHAAGCAFVKDTAMAPVSELFDIVITSNSGYPLDLNLYQAVKGMSAAAQVVKPGGAIIVAAECWDGIPDHGLYAQLLREAGSPQAVLDILHAPGFLKQDQWQVQMQAQIQLRADVYVYSDHLSVVQITDALLKPCRSIADTVAALVEQDDGRPRICILPEGPQTIPYVRG